MQATEEPRPVASEAERRQLTVMFCDLVGPTALSAQLDPEDYRAVVQRYQRICTEVIQRYEGYLAQYLGDGLLVYFGYPTAHEDDAARAVRTGLGIVEALQHLYPQLPQPLQVRIGIHTGLVVIGDIGAGSRMEQLALGETPNLAARIQGLAESNTVLISATTQRLVEGQPFGSHPVKGIATPIAIYHIQSERQGTSPWSGKATLTPLVGREQELGLLLDRWDQTKEGHGQVVLLSGEPGIGKSRLAYTLREHVSYEGSVLFEARCSPYHQHSALYPLLEVLQRTFLLTTQDTNDDKVQRLERTLALVNMLETVPLFTALLSLPTPAQYPPLNHVAEAERTDTPGAAPVVGSPGRAPSHGLGVGRPALGGPLVIRVPFVAYRTNSYDETAARADLPSGIHAAVEATLPHLAARAQPAGPEAGGAMIDKVAAGQRLSAAVMGQIRIKTDGVPLFVEELTKSMVETGGAQGRTSLQPLAIPATLHEARLELARSCGWTIQGPGANGAGLETLEIFLKEGE